MDGFELNKIIAAFLTAGLIAGFAGFAANKMVHPKESEMTSAAPVAVAQMPEPILPMIARADAEKGKAIAKACGACHNLDKGGPDMVGPNLWDVLTRGRGAKAGYAYSDAMKAKGGKWDYADLNRFLWKPSSLVPGTKMTFPGLKKPEDRAAVVAYLRTLADSTPPPPSDAAIAAEAKELTPPPAAAAPASEPGKAAAAPAAAGAEPILAMLAKADAAKGQSLAKACGACHNMDKGGPNMVGPNLWNVLTRGRGAKSDYAYSDAMKAKGGKWDYASLNEFLWKPSSLVPGTKMTFPGFKKPEDRANVIVYLRTLADAPPALPSDAAIKADK